MIRRNVVFMKNKLHLKNQKKSFRRSAALVWTVVTSTVMLGAAAMAVDVGYIYCAKTQLQVAADAAAMAAARQLNGSSDVFDAILELAREYAAKNKVFGITPQLADSDVVLGHTVIDDSGKSEFRENEQPYDALKVTIRLTADSPNGQLPLFFGKLMKVAGANVSASATAMLVPRDIAIAIDLSNSMSYDSQLRHEKTTEINIKQVWQDLGSPTYGKMTTFHSDNQMPYYKGKTVTEIKQLLGLNNVPYPFAGGSWNDYIKYVNGSGSSKDNKAICEDYEYRYGLRTFVNYLMDCRSLSTETPALKDCRVQPVYAMKQAVEELCNYLILMDSDDQVALISYSNTADLEEQLTKDYTQIIQATRQQQAGQKGSSTNIANGIERCRQELKSQRARSSAKKVMIVMTDGKANLPSNEKTGKLQAINAGHSAVNQGIQIYTISLGTEADQQLMEELAQLGKGIHYHVPTFDISQYEEDLKRVFRTVGGKRPVRLVE